MSFYRSWSTSKIEELLNDKKYVDEIINASKASFDSNERVIVTDRFFGSYIDDNGYLFSRKTLVKPSIFSPLTSIVYSKYFVKGSYFFGFSIHSKINKVLTKSAH